MSDENTTPHSGSRWEPRADASGAPTPPPPVPAPAPLAEPADRSGAVGGMRRSVWAERVRGRGGLLAGGLALVLATGVGGFAIGEVAHHDGGGRPAFGVGYQPQDAQFPAPAPGFGDDHGSDGHSFGDDDGGQLGGGFTDDGGAQQGSSL